MKKFILNIVLIIIIIPVGIKAQNLVYNGSFEIRDSVFFVANNKWFICPDDASSIGLQMVEIAKGWYNIQGNLPFTFDYFNKCDYDSIIGYGIVGVPKNNWLTLYQYPRTGDGYSAGMFYGIYPNNNIIPGEIIQSKLKNKLRKDSIYFLRLYANLANASKYSMNSQGAFLSNNKIKVEDLYQGLLDSTIKPQIYNNIYIEDTLNWIEVSGYFRANGNEEYISIGNFNINIGLEKLFNPNGIFIGAAYAIDDISLYPVSAPVDSARCGDDTLICLGNSLTLGKSQVKPKYRNEYSFEWYVSGREDSVFSYDEHPLVTPSKTTTYIVKVVDFKFDHTTDSITVKVVDCTEPTSLVVYPNPSFGEFDFSFNAPIPEGMSIEIFDLTGRLLKTKYYEQDYENKEVKLNLKPYPAGMYLYSVVFNNERKFTGKLILIK